MPENIITSLIPSTPNPTIETVKKIADALDVSLACPPPPKADRFGGKI